MASADREREEQLVEAGKRLLQPPSSVDELLLLLDRVENFLSRVEQSPSKSMLTALSPTMKALVADELLGHPNEDVRVAVASCISEITRITAPEAPYDDDRMKEVFQLIVSSFENLSDKSGRSYSKRTLILETVAKVRSCVVMLDLECDGLIVEMFQHFLKAIRDYHPENVFSSMETIMTLVLEESEDIALELISPILASLKKDNNEVQPIAQKLAEKVFGNCAAKVKPCLIHAKSSLNLSFDDYNTVISSICNGTSHGVGQDDHKASGKKTKEVMVDGASSEVAAQGEVNKSAVTSPDEAAQDPVTKETITESRNGQDNTASVETVHGDDHSAPAETGTGKDSHAPVEAGPGEDHPLPVETGPGEDHPASEMSSKSVTSNGVAETEKEESADPGSSEKLEQTNQDDQSLEANVSGIAEPGDSVSGKIAKVESKSEQTSKKRSRKSKNSTDSAEPCDSFHLDTDKEAKRVTDGDRSLDKEVHASPSRDPSIEVTVSAENEKESDQISSPNTLDNEPKNVVSPSASGHVLEDGRSRKTGRSKKKSNLIKKASPTDAATEKASEGTKNSEVKLRGRSGKKALTGDSLVENDFPAKISKVEGGSASDSDAKVVEKSSKKADIKDLIGDESSSKKKDDGKRRVRGKTALEKETVSSPKHSKVVEDESPLGETLKISSKRKRTPAKEKGTDVKESGDDLVGSKIKVWWPMDKMYYEGVIVSFDSVKKRHTVSYTDGDLEMLILKNEKWELVGGEDSVTDGERATKLGGPDTSPEIERKKRAKTGSEPSAKHGKTEGLRDGDASSSKSKGAATKSGHKSMDDTKVDGKLKDDTPKSSAKSEDGGKSKIRSKKNRRGKSAGDTSEKADKSKDEDGGTPKPSIKFKVGSPKIATKDSPKTAIKDTPKTATKDTPKTAIKDTPKTGTKNVPKGGSKGKGSKSGGKSSAGKVKSGSIKLKETEGKEKSPEVVKTPESGKGKSTGTSKGKENDGKSGKKRRRGVKS